MLTLRCDDGSPDIVVATEAGVTDLYDRLWLLAGRVDGAITAAAKLQHARQTPGRHSPSDTLSATEATVVRAALERGSRN